MHIGSIYENEREWLHLQKSLSAELDEFNHSLKYVGKKIHFLQVIVGSVRDFENVHHFRKELYPRPSFSLFGAQNTKKYHEAHLRAIRKTIRKLRSSMRAGMRLDAEQLTLAERITHQLHKLKTTPSVDDLRKTFFQLHQIITDQNLVIARLFTAVQHAEYLARKEDAAHTHVQEEVALLAKEVRPSLAQLVELVIREVYLLTGVTLDARAVLSWSVVLSSEKSIVTKTILSAMEPVHDVVRWLREERVLVFHASHVPVSVPLDENKKSVGFFVCEDKAAYAKNILKVRSHLVERDKIFVYRIELPLRIFKQLFTHDFNEGDERFHGSREAYVHAFFMPVSRYATFNNYVRQGVISFSQE